jgi:hypothetical protein
VNFPKKANTPGRFRRQWGLVLLGLGWLGSLQVGPLAQELRSPGPATRAQPTLEAEKVAAELGIGRWIWTTNFTDKQTCRLWRAFTIPETNVVRKANLRLTADNSYRLFLDGREIGQGGNWKSLTDYDVTWLLDPGRARAGRGGVQRRFGGRLDSGFENRICRRARRRCLPINPGTCAERQVRRWMRRTHPDPRWQRTRKRLACWDNFRGGCDPSTLWRRRHCGRRKFVLLADRLVSGGGAGGDGRGAGV